MRNIISSTGAFLIPYTLSFFLAAAPTYIAEISLGQYMSAGVVQAWKMIPIFQGKHIFNAACITFSTFSTFLLQGAFIKDFPDLLSVKVGSLNCTQTLPYTSIGHMIICSSET